MMEINSIFINNNIYSDKFENELRKYSFAHRCNCIFPGTLDQHLNDVK